MEKGNLSINSENILPIIKKWLYSDTDIFLRELVSNATDAITKLQKLRDMGEAVLPENEKFEIQVSLDVENKIIQIIDNGIGMTSDEIKQYINQIAFSGASDFISKYHDKLDQSGEIIGHFGLGFYSSFMVADRVSIDTLSYKEGEAPAKWTCDGGIDYEMEEGTRTERGTTITLYVGEDGEDFLDEYKLRTVLKKYCAFMPVEIFFDVVKETTLEDVSDDNEISEEEIVAPTPINNTSPLWLKKASECTDEEYKQFYKDAFADYNDPLFWIHLNMDYPFRLKGILYFPKLKNEPEFIEGQVKLFNNQVFIADNIKEVIPEFLLLLKGTLDCPDLPLNVSRSFLQNDGYVTKMSGYITKKVADKLNSLFKKERESYTKFWEDISPFIKYGCIKQKDFYDKISDSILFKTLDGEYLTLPEFSEKNKEKTGDKVFYVTNERQQSQYVKLFRDNELDAVILSNKLDRLDTAFISHLENYTQDFKFMRIDSDLSDVMKSSEDDSEEDKEVNSELEQLFRSKLNDDKLKIQVESLKSDSVSAVILLSEQSRRMQEMSKMFGGAPMGDMFGNEETLVLNKNNTLVKTLLALKDDTNKSDDTQMICEQIYDLAMMSHKPLNVSAMTKFIERSNKLLEKIANI